MGGAMDYNLSGLGSRSFEQMTQALMVGVFGSGVTVFGDGPDGGREATFRGAATIPDYIGNQSWNGYVVAQAKFRAPESAPARNTTWLKAQLKKELDLWLPSAGDKQRTDCPDYYIALTNVRLSGVEETGGIDVLNEFMKGYVHALGLKGFAIWSYAQICALVDNNTDVRRLHLNVIVPGDLIAALMQSYENDVPDLGRMISSNAMEVLRDQQWVRLGDSGVDDGSKLSMADIAVDLPARPLDDGEAEEDFVLRRILRAASNRTNRSVRAHGAKAGALLVGGPGQGKSTVTRLLSQAYRASLLEENSALLPAQRRLAEATIDAFKRLGIAMPTFRRWPISVELSEFADFLAEKPDSSLMAYIAKGVRADGDTVRANQLTKWRSAFPWLLVLDGIDEIPNPDMRERVTSAVNAFISDVNLRDDDVYIVATTRPQGYHGEFTDFDLEGLEILPLSPGAAIAYGTLLLEARHRDDPSQERAVRARLKAAALNPITQRLMTSPLQVTIMSTLLERLTRVPETRHALFEAYYDTIYRREEVKASYLGDILARHRDVVDFVHEQIGAFLHAAAASTGAAEPLLAKEQLRSLAREKLTDDGYAVADVDRLTNQLVAAVENRVVLLVGAEQGYVGFEVRSIQEYMAARAISRGTDEQVLERLRRILPLSHWRNVWLLSVARISERSPHLQAEILLLLRAADTASEIANEVGPGQRLAVELLEDDYAVSKPIVRRNLLRHGLDMLYHWPERQLVRLAHVGMAVAADDGTAQDLLKTASNVAINGDGPSKASAVLVLRIWEKEEGALGSMATQLLQRTKGWRPELNEKRRRELLSIVLDKYIDRATFPSAVRSTADTRVSVGLLAAEVAAASRGIQFPHNAQVQFILALRDADTLKAFISLLGALPLSDGQAALFVRSALISKIESDEYVPARDVGVVGGALLD